MKKMLMLVVAMMGLSACTIVSTGERGVRYNFGRVSDEVMTPGTYLWIPYFMGSKTLNVQTHPYEEVLSSGTKDQQEVTNKITINMGVQPEKVVHVVSEYGNDTAVMDRVIPVIRDAVNAVTSRFNAEELLTKRPEVKKEIEELVRERVKDYGVHVQDVSLTDLQYSKEYSAAIERKQVAEQAAKQAEYDTLKATQEAKSRIAEAEGQAKATLAKARAEAEANSLKLKTLTNELIQYEMVQRWNGQLPQVQSGSGGTMMLNFTPNSKKSE